MSASHDSSSGWIWRLFARRTASTERYMSFSYVEEIDGGVICCSERERDSRGLICREMCQQTFAMLGALAWQVNALIKDQFRRCPLEGRSHGLFLWARGFRLQTLSLACYLLFLLLPSKTVSQWCPVMSIVDRNFFTDIAERSPQAILLNQYHQGIPFTSHKIQFLIFNAIKIIISFARYNAWCLSYPTP